MIGSVYLRINPLRYNIFFRSEYSSLRVVGGKVYLKMLLVLETSVVKIQLWVGELDGWQTDIWPDCVKNISTLIDSIQEELEFDPPEEEVTQRIEQILEKFHQGNLSGGTTLNLALQKTEENIVKKVIIVKYRRLNDSLGL